MRSAPHIKTRIFELIVAGSLLHSAQVLFLELPRTPGVRHVLLGAAAPSAVEFSARAVNTIREIAPTGNIFLRFDLPPDRSDLAEFFYYTWTYELYPRCVFVTTESRVINNGHDLIGLPPPRDGGWVLAHDVSEILLVWLDEQASFCSGCRCSALSPLERHSQFGSSHQWLVLPCAHAAVEFPSLSCLKPAASPQLI